MTQAVSMVVAVQVRRTLQLLYVVLSELHEREQKRSRYVIIRSSRAREDASRRVTVTARASKLLRWAVFPQFPNSPSRHTIQSLKTCSAAQNKSVKWTNTTDLRNSVTIASWLQCQLEGSSLRARSTSPAPADTVLDQCKIRRLALYYVYL